MTIHKVFRPFHLTILGYLLFHRAIPSAHVVSVQVKTLYTCTPYGRLRKTRVHAAELDLLQHVHGSRITVQGRDDLPTEKVGEIGVQKRRMQSSKAAWAGKG